MNEQTPTIEGSCGGAGMFMSDFEPSRHALCASIDFARCDTHPADELCPPDRRGDMFAVCYSSVGLGHNLCFHRKQAT